MADVIPIMPAVGDLPEAFQVLRDQRRQAFVWAYVFNGAQGKAAAIAAGYSDVADGAKVRACELLQREDVGEAIKALTGRYLFSLAPKAVLRLNELLDNPRHPKHVRAIELTLDRTGHVAKTAVDVTVGGTVTVNHTDAALADLERLQAMGVPRAELERIFGFSGLERYERMLAKRPKVIEGEIVSRETIGSGNGG